MENIKSGEELPKKKRGRPPKKITENLLETLKTGEWFSKKKKGKVNKDPQGEIAQPIEKSEEVETTEDSEDIEEQLPDWKNFDIQSIATIQQRNDMINLKSVKTDKNGHNYIEIEGRKYYEYKGQGECPKSFYKLLPNSLFIGDKINGLSIWNGVSFICSSRTGENIDFEQRKSRYLNGSVYLEKIYKFSSFPASRVLTTIRKGGKIIKVTEKMVGEYLNGSQNKNLELVINIAKKTDPEFLAYMESLDK